MTANFEDTRRHSGSSPFPYSIESSQTRIIKGSGEVGNHIISLITKASRDSISPFLNTAIDKFGPIILPAYFAVSGESMERNPEFAIRIITDIQLENIQYVKQMIKGGKGIEVRHYEGNIRKFVFSRTEALETSHTLQNGQPEEAVYSNDTDFVAQLSQVFDALWQRAIPAEQRITEIEKGDVPRKTEIFRGTEEAASISLKVFRDAERYFCAVSDWRAPSLAVDVDLYRNAYLDMKKRGILVRAVTEVRKENILFCKEIQRLGLVTELRHIDGSMGNYVVTEKEYLAAPTIQESTQAQEIVYSNNKGMVAQNKYIFDTLWSKAIPAEVKIKQLEDGIEPEETRLVQDVNELVKITEKCFENCQEETLVILASEKTITRNLRLFEKLAALREANQFKRLQILSPIADPTVLNIMPNAEWRRIVFSPNITLFIFDSNKMLLVQYSDPEAASREFAVSNSIYTTNKQTISGMIAVFRALWKENELRKLAETVRDKEERARRQAELMQDILTHDIRNYNQISKLSAELLKDQFAKSNSSVESAFDNLIRSINGSTSLLERVRKLSRIISETNPSLYSIDLLDSIDDSITIVTEAFPGKKIKFSGDLKNLSTSKSSRAKRDNLFVQADNLLAEAFVNIFSNSVKYTESNKVPIEIRMANDVQLPSPNLEGGYEKLNSSNQRYCKVTITDYGRGISNENKKNVFVRYFHSGTHSGSGLGLAIVYALVFERYRGSVLVRDRIEGDCTKGTSVDLWLPLSYS